MTWLRLAWSKLAALVSSRRLDDDFDEELASHLALAEDDGRRHGLDAAAARHAALRQLGGVARAKERHRDTRGVPVIDSLRQDLAYALRTLRKTPVFTFVIIASLALGIGANTAVFTLLNAVLLRTLPVAQPEQLVRLTAAPVLSYAMYQDLRERQHVFTDMAASSREWHVRLVIPPASGAGGAGETGDTAGTETVTIDNAPTGFVSAHYFRVLGLTPRLGRFFREDEDSLTDSAESQGSVAVLSDAFWTRQFGRDPGVLGRFIQVNRGLCRVIGVAPPGFVGEAVGQTVDIWVPLVPFSPARYLTERRGQFTRTIARLKPGVTLEQARGAMTPLFRQLLEDEWRNHPETRPRDNRPARDHAFEVTAASTGVDGENLRLTFTTPLYIVMAIAAAVLLIACANVANLLLARAAWQRREFSVRLGLGCSRGRLMRQLLTESLLLAALGAASGLLLAFWGSRVLHTMADAGPLALTPDPRVLAFVASVTVLTGIGFGIAPALRGSRIDVAIALNEHARRGAGGGGASRRRVSRTLVMSQIGLSLMLLIGAGLLVRSLYNLRSVDLGFEPEQVIVFQVAHRPATNDRAAVAQTLRDVRQRIREIPGVRSASLSTVVLFSGTEWRALLHIPGYQPPAGEEAWARTVNVSPGYFETVGMTLLAGRGIDARDTVGAPRVAVVNDALVRRYFPGMPVGRVLGKTMTQAISLPSGPGQSGPIEIVGVVRDARFNDVRETARPLMYEPYLQHPGGLRGIEVRTAEPITTMTEAVRRTLLQVAPEAMIRHVRTLEEQVDRTIGPERMIANLCVAFGGLALLLAAIGLYGVMAYSVAHRTGEIGIRMALGATRGGVLRLVLAESAPIVMGGALLGLVGAWAASRLIGSLLFGLTPTDGVTMTAATAVLIVVSALAVYVPARRAARVEPMAALRHE